MIKVYTNGTKYSTRKFNGAHETYGHAEGEQYMRASKRNGYEKDGVSKPSFWGTMNVNTNRIQRIVHSRAEARRIRKPNEKVIAGWV